MKLCVLRGCKNINFAINWVAMRVPDEITPAFCMVFEIYPMVLLLGSKAEENAPKYKENNNFFFIFAARATPEF